jgi:hypothetical protein
MDKRDRKGVDFIQQQISNKEGRAKFDPAFFV